MKTPLTLLEGIMIAFLKNLIEKDIIKEIFLHFRNIGIAALVIAAGWHVGVKGDSQYVWLVSSKISGYGVITIGIILFLLNMIDGLYKLSKVKYGAILDMVLIVIYMIISFRLVKILTEFRLNF